MSAGTSASPIVSNDRIATMLINVSPVSPPRYGMKLSNAAATPHSAGFGMPETAMPSPTTHPKPMLMTVMVSR